MGWIVGVGCAVAVTVGLVVLAACQVRGESSPRRRPRGPGVGVGGGGLEELHALFSPGKRVQIEQRREQLAHRDDAEAGAPPHFGVDLDRGVAVLRRPEEDGAGTGATGAGGGRR